jgi:DNA-binding transcriptional LysR family regulator
MDLNLLKSFLAVAEHGSFTQAARRLKQPKSRVSRAIQRLESELGLQLLQRTTRQTRLTEAGLNLFQQNQPLLRQLEHNLQQAAEAHCSLSGTLHLTAPEDFAQAVLLPLMQRFRAQYPEIRFALHLGNTYLDLIGQQLDLAFRIGQLEDTSLMQRVLGQVSLILVAAPAYLNQAGGPPSDLAALKNFALLRFVNDNPYTGSNVLPEDILPFHSSAFACNQFSLLYQLALSGQGIATLPDFYAREALASGQLVRVLPQWTGAPRNIHLLYPPTLSLPLRTRRLIDFVVEASPALLQPANS